VIGDVKAAAFEEQSGPGADFLFHPAMPPFFPRTKLLRADPQRIRGNGADDLKLVAAFFANVFVSGHRLMAGGFYSALPESV
jgi:hypothetical protein